jgi:hypothetical protein
MSSIYLRVDGTGTMLGPLRIGLNGAVSDGSAAVSIKQYGRTAANALDSTYGIKHYDSLSNNSFYTGFTSSLTYGIFSCTGTTYSKIVEFSPSGSILYTFLDMNFNRIHNLANPIGIQDAATKNYVDANCVRLDGTAPMTGNLNMTTNRIIFGANNNGDSAICIKQPGRAAENALQSTYGIKYYDSVSNNAYYTSYSNNDSYSVYYQSAGGAHALMSQINSWSNLSYTNGTGTYDAGCVNLNTASTFKYYFGNHYNNISSSNNGVFVNTLNFNTLSGINILENNNTIASITNGSLTMHNNRIINLANPTSAQDAATKSYIDSISPTFLKLNGTTPMVGTLNLNANRIVNVADPLAAQDAATKSYADSAITSLATAYLLLNGTNGMAGSLNLNANRIVNVADPIAAQDAATKSYADSSIASLSTTYLMRSGANGMAGVLNMGSNKIVNVADPLAAQDAATKSYADSSIASLSTTYLMRSGANGMAGVLNMGSNKIVNVADPLAAQDAATKSYVDRRRITWSGSVGVATYTKLVSFTGGSSIVDCCIMFNGLAARLSISRSNGEVRHHVYPFSAPNPISMALDYTSLWISGDSVNGAVLTLIITDETETALVVLDGSTTDINPSGQFLLIPV